MNKAIKHQRNFLDRIPDGLDDILDYSYQPHKHTTPEKLCTYYDKQFSTYCVQGSVLNLELL